MLRIISLNAYCQNMIYMLNKDVSDRFQGEKSYLRLAVRTVEDNQKFVQCFHQVVTEIKDLANIS